MLYPLLSLLIVFFLIIIFSSNQMTQENFLFCAPDDCTCVCNRNEYQGYCENPYSKGGPQALCDCKWNQQTRLCDGMRSPSSNCRSS